MIFYPLSLAVLAIWLVLILRRLDDGFVLAIALLPFGMFAALALPALGGLSIIASSLVAALTGGLVIVASLLGRGAPVLTASTLVLGFYAAYAAFSAVVLVRLFAGQFEVFTLARSMKGVQINPFFSSVPVPLRPGSSNISQSFYILLSFLVFLTFKDSLRRRGIAWGDRALVMAGTLNIVLALMDMARLDPILAQVRTATYALANEQTMGGFARVIGGYSEPSAFGGASAAFFAYFTAAFIGRRRGRDLALGAGNGLCTIAALSATGLFAMGVVGLMILMGALPSILRPQQRLVVIGSVVGICLFLAGTCLLLTFTPLPDLAASLFERIFLAKADSSSGIERKAWALSGFAAFRETWGLGAGAGSLRSNGLVAVLLGSVGLPGTLALATFLWLAVGRSWRGAEAGTFQAARAGVVALLAGAALSGTSPDPGLLMITFCAIACAIREHPEVAAPARAEARPLPGRRAGHGRTA
ncbi:hypothetical protein [Cereibacter sphaeroides]|uniref:hypothetical protein n=1 Tax=Cereibacter sphaeroides TaxID=1063 RepID=UPI001F344A2C|nr:hypothetical protein [Cereibacter sphaeroides]MCE6967560.1 hypothetical protein [Cereibacter sphaeroides]